jgi:hypothetical protein
MARAFRAATQPDTAFSAELFASAGPLAAVHPPASRRA